MKKSISTPLFFIGIILLCYLLLLLFVFPFFTSLGLFIVDTSMMALSVLFFAIAAFRNPGYLERPKSTTFLNLLQNFDPVLLCPDCMVIRTKRSRHCSICNQCVERFDHHCPWINNCVGTRNHFAFMGFLSCITLTLVLMVISISCNFSNDTRV